MKVLKMMFNVIIWVISLSIPKSKKYVVIGGWYGKRYADNSKAMYEYLELHKNELGIKRVFWYTKNKDIFNELKKTGKDVLYGYNIKSIYWHFRSKIHMIDQSTHDILHVFSVRCIRINLWHGIPLKRIGNYSHNKRNVGWRDKWYVGGGWADCYILSPSELSAYILRNAMGIRKRKCIIASYPRNEKLYYCKSDFDGIGQFNVFYLPTFRDIAEVNPLLNEDIEYINQQFAVRNIVMYIKPHFVSTASWNTVTTMSNIKILDATEDVYDRLYKTDLLITDYSSVMFDYMITKRPMLFYAYDLQYYESNDRGFILPYDKVTPGKKVYDAGELIREIIFIYNNYDLYIEQYKKQYESINTKMNKYLDNPNYSEILQFWNS